jgi:sugar phosphate isomerase/epimerase
MKTKIVLPTLIFNKPLSLEQQVINIKEYGAEGIEIRRERLQNISAELKILKGVIEAEALDPVIYSVPVELWQTSFSINPAAVTAIKEAETLNATHIKFSLGNFEASQVNGDIFRKWLHENLPSHLKILIENDQTEYGGSLNPILSFFQWNNEASVRMTFDIGNWTVNNEDWLNAYQALHPWIDYLHIKSAIKSPEGWGNAALSLDHLNIPFPAFTAIEFSLDDPDYEAPQWIESIKRKTYVNQ